MIEYIIGLSPNIKSSVIIIVALMIIVSIIGHKVGKLKPTDQPKGIAFIAILLVDTLNNFIKEFYGNKWRTYAPLLIAVLLFLAFANTSSLFGLATPLANMSVALSFSLFAFLTIQISGIMVRNPINRIKDLSSPKWWLLPINIVGEISTPLAMGLRLFGNLLSGSVMAIVVFNLLNKVASVIVTVFVLHPIFNIGFGLIQAFVYFMLLTIFLSMAVSDEEAITTE
ncbi:MAG: F0F1 ATP synthase subunit A [Candidatus Izemoplasmataceae bacterium]|jgi:F-type H+-transporting ATPase subunit a